MYSNLAIIDEARWERVQEIISSIPRRQHKKIYVEYLLDRVLFRIYLVLED